MAQLLATASKLTFAKIKYRIYDNKHSGSIQIKEQYSPGSIKLTLHPWTVLLGCQIVDYDLLNAKQSSKNEPVWAL